MLPTTNKTVLGDWNDLERGGLMCWSVVILLLSLTGNTIILVASIRYRAIKQSKMSVTLIENVAVSDLGVTIFGIFPNLLTNFKYNIRHVPWLCVSQFALHGLCIASSIFLVCALNIFKLLSLKFPLRSRLWTRRVSVRVAIAIWLFSGGLCGFITLTAVNFKEIYLDYRTGYCMYKVSTLPMKFMALVQTLVEWTLPQIIVVTSSIWILRIAKMKSRQNATGSWRWQSTVTILLIAASYCISYIPLTCWFSMYNFKLIKGQEIIETVDENGKHTLVFVQYDETGQPMTGFGYNGLYLLLTMFTYLNNVANIFIYIASMTSFRRALKDFIGLSVGPSVSDVGSVYYNQTHNGVILDHRC